MNVHNLLLIGLIASLAACGGGNSTDNVASASAQGSNDAAVASPAQSTTGVAPGPLPDGMPAVAGAAGTTAQDNRQKALQLWRNDLPSKHPKGSCASCHGADFFDLARMGSTDSDILRRALIDGATSEEAEALRAAVVGMRQELRLPVQDPRAFRPFQPGGRLLLPDLTEMQSNIAAVKRDIAFAENVARLAPALYGGRVTTLAQARQVRDQMLDIARGTNSAGTNPDTTQLRDLPVGIAYPRWSADKFHSTSEGTLNDWLSDLAFIPKPESKAAWEALQDAYLANPGNDTFWPMYSAVDSLLKLATPLGTCTAPGPSGTDGAATVRQAVCDATPGAFKHKFKSALIGQHMMRLEALGRRSEFVSGAIGFSYLDLDAKYKTVPKIGWSGRSMLPSPLWEVGDHLGRSIVGQPAVLTLGESVASLGLPQFVVNSIESSKAKTQEEQDLRLPWMWIGFTFDPSCARIASSNSTKVAEYLVSSLNQAMLFNHNAFMTHMRMLSSTFLDEASTTGAGTATGVQRVANDRVHGVIDYSYFFGYGRNVGNFGYDQWKESLLHGGSGPLPQALKDRSLGLWSTQVSNGSRAVLLLLLDELQNRPERLDQKWLSAQAAEIQAQGPGAWLGAFRQHWDKFQPQHVAADDALVRQVAQAVTVAATR